MRVSSGQSSVSFGNRGTAGNSMSPGCGVLFFAVFFPFGLGCLCFFGYQAWKDYRVRTVYRETTCTILGKRLKESTDSDGTTYAPEFTFRYHVNNQEYTCTGYDSFGATSSGRAGKEKILARYDIGGQYPCWYNPDRPWKAVLVKTFNWMYLFALLPLVFLAVGVGGIVWGIRNWGRSPEAMAAERVSQCAAKPGGVQTGEGLNLLPPVKKLQGIGQSVRLSRGTSVGLEMGGLLFFCLFWNGIVSVFVYPVLKDWRRGSLEIIPALFLVPFF